MEVTAGVRMLEMMLEKSEEKAEKRAAPKNGSATRRATGWTLLLSDDCTSNGELNCGVAKELKTGRFRYSAGLGSTDGSTL